VAAFVSTILRRADYNFSGNATWPPASTLALPSRTTVCPFRLHVCNQLTDRYVVDVDLRLLPFLDPLLPFIER
jgi:hypothetical protein